MTDASNSGSDRRDFLAQMATAGVAFSASALVPFARAEAQPMRAAPFDDSWARRVSAAKYKAVFDSPGVEDGLALMHATFFMQGYHEQFDTAPSDTVPVVVLRHAGTPLALNDAMWEKYALGERTKVKDPVTNADAVRNPFAKREEKGIVPPEASIEGLLASGAVVLACNKAAMRMATTYAQKMNRDVEEVRAEFRAGLVPGVIYQPSGIYAVHRAQGAGCTFIKS
ncbi:MAG: hypothetical protein ABIY52_17555, partial [Gemmatimonadaceae bacterium]